MKKTPLCDAHNTLNARMIDFAGWKMPIMYTSIIEEHIAVRTKAGIFDISHMGEIRLQGKGAEALLRALVPTSLDKLENQKGMYTCFCNDQGGIVDDIFIFMEGPESYYLVVNAATKDKDLNWIKSHNKDNVAIFDLSDETAKIDIQGPSSTEIITALFMNSTAADLKRFYFDYVDYQGSQIMIAKTGYTGEIGYELFLSNSIAQNIWNRMLEVGEERGLQPAGLGARDTLRLEACYSLYGHELSDTISPVEGGLSWIVSSNDEYVARDIVEKQKTEGSSRKIVCLEIRDKGIARENCPLFFNQKKIGYITSGAFSPTLQKSIALALVEKDSVKVDDAIEIEVRNRKLTGVVVNRPFYNFNG